MGNFTEFGNTGAGAAFYRAYPRLIPLIGRVPPTIGTRPRRFTTAAASTITCKDVMGGSAKMQAAMEKGVEAAAFFTH